MAGITEIAKEAGLKYNEVSKAIDGIRKLLKKGEKITIQDFGTFYIDVQDERLSRNPTTGEKVSVNAKSTPRFKYNYTFKKSIEEDVQVDLEKLDKKRKRKEKLHKKAAGE